VNALRRALRRLGDLFRTEDQRRRDLFAQRLRETLRDGDRP
jgi:hypothetical protein